MRPLRLEPSLKLGVDAIDAQHEEMVEMINETQVLLENDSDATELVRILNRLNDLCIDHFTLEEELMSKAGYPGLEAHREQHDNSIRRAFGFDASRLGSDPEAGWALLQMLRDWLLAHIQTDREMVQFIKAKGIA